MKSFFLIISKHKNKFIRFQRIKITVTSYELNTTTLMKKKKITNQVSKDIYTQCRDLVENETRLIRF